MIKEVTNSQKDWNDFWYNAVVPIPTSEEDIMTEQTNAYASQVDHLVNTMNQDSSDQFDAEAYQVYKQSVKSGQLNTNENLTEVIVKLGFQLDQQLAKIILQLDKVLDSM